MRSIVFLFLFSACVFAVTPSDTLFAKGSHLPTGVWKPAKITSKTELTIWFHGGMTSNRCNKGLEAGNGIFELLQNQIVISPSACSENHWLNAQVITSVNEAIDSLEKRIGQKFATVNLVGVSDGCMGVLHYSIVGNRKVKTRLLISGNLSQLNIPPENFANQERMQQGSWTFLQGGADRLYPLQTTLPWIEGFCSGKVKCVKHIDPNGEHDWSYWVNNRKNWILEAL